MLISPLFAFTQSAFTIKADVKELKDGDKIYFAYHLNKVLYKDSTTAKDQSFVFHGSISGPAFGLISARENPFADIEVLHNSINLYVEPGNITINGIDSLKFATVGGTPDNLDYAELVNELWPYSNKLARISKDFDALPAAEQKKVDRIAANRIAYYNVLNQMAPVRFAFIKRHRDSYISLETLKDMLNQADVNSIDSAYQSLSARLKNSPEGMAFEGRVAAARRSRSGTIANDFSLPDAGGKLVRLSDYHGKYVLVDFWASWCMPCRQENPNVKTAFERFKSKNFTIISVSIDEQASKAAWLQAIKADGLPWTQLLDASQKVRDLYGVTYIPANFLIDPNGRIVAANLRDKALIDKLIELLGSEN